MSSIILLLLTLPLLYLLGGESSNDAQDYADLWFRLQGNGFLSAISAERFEIGFIFLYWCLSKIFSPTITFYVCGVISLAFKHYLMARHLQYASFAFITYCSIFLQVLDANQIRAALSACFVLYALLVSQGAVFYILIAIVASLFHYSGLIILFMLFIRTPFVGLCLIIFLGVYFNDIVLVSGISQLSIWLSSPEIKANLTSSIFIMQVFISIVCVIAWKGFTVEQRKGAYLIICGTFIYLTFNENAILAHRLRELSLLGILPLLFQGGRIFSVAQAFISLCVFWISSYILWFTIDELLHIYF